MGKKIIINSRHFYPFILPYKWAVAWKSLLWNCIKKCWKKGKLGNVYLLAISNWKILWTIWLRNYLRRVTTIKRKKIKHQILLYQIVLSKWNYNLIRKKNYLLLLFDKVDNNFLVDFIWSQLNCYFQKDFFTLLNYLWLCICTCILGHKNL